MIPFFFYIFIFLFGLIVGSFLNSFIYRLSLSQKITAKRSFCPYCQHPLSWQDLIPILSFFLLKGKCRYCRQKISLQYPLVEIATAILFLLTSLTIGNFYTMVYFLLISCFLILIFVYDLKYFIIPDKIIYSAISIVFIYRLFENLEFRIWEFTPSADGAPGRMTGWISDFEPLAYSLFSAIFALTFFLLIFLISRGKWLGFGDVKLAFFMGFFLGFPKILVALFFAFFIGAIIGIGLIISGKKKLKSEVPFGPFLVASTFIALFFGEKIISWYLKLLGL